MWIHETTGIDNVDAFIGCDLMPPDQIPAEALLDEAGVSSRFAG